MREELLQRLRCPSCSADGAFALTVHGRDEREVRDAILRCGGCASEFPIRAGIVEMLNDPPDYVRREAAGLGRFADVMRADGWDGERIRQLPVVELGYWWEQRRAFEYWEQELAFRPGAWLLDVGSNTCWASALFARRGLEVIALDIATVDLQGLGSAEHFIADGSVYFERLLSTMAAPALASNSMDYVFCCEALHHNSPGELRRTLREFFRVLRPGGQLLLVNEPLRFPRNLKRDHGREVAEFEGNEHVYFLHQYVLAARRAGFRTSLRWPRNIPDAPRPTGEPIARPQRSAARRLGGRARVVWKLGVTGEVSLNMLCRKPA
jgi:SAM-dependent methyltransferase